MRKKLTQAQKSARKAARTRAANVAMMKRWREVDEPAARRAENLFNSLLKGRTVQLRWNPPGGVSRKLMHDATYGELVSVRAGGRIWRVLPEGYRRPQDWHCGFWEPLFDKEGATNNHGKKRAN